MNARADIDVKTLWFNKFAYTDVAIDGDVRDGRLVLERATAVTPQGDVALTLSVLPSAGGADVTANFDGNKIDVARGRV